MKGLHHIVLETGRLKYEFDIKRNITIILGDSASGKTTMVGLLTLFAARKKSSGVILQSDVPCEVYNGSQDAWKSILSDIHKSIIFIDEGYDFIFTEEFADLLEASDNYYVLITRKPIRNLPYSIHEIYGIRTTGKYHFPEKVYHEFYPIIEETPLSKDPYDNVTVITEDEGSGYQFFSKSFHSECTSAKGNSNYYKCLKAMGTDKKSLIIADGAAFGAYVDNILDLREAGYNISLYLPESFEWIILKSGVVKANNLNEVLANPENYIESSVYFSWERFFTDYLRNATKDNRLQRYNKSRLSAFYTKGQVQKDIINTLPDVLRNLYQECNPEITASSDT